MIRVYDDKLIIWNQGQLPDTWTVAQLLQAHPSVPYNPTIANVFFRAGLIEAWGRGTIRMIDDCVKDNAPAPVFKYDFSGFMVAFTFKELNKGSQKMSVEMSGEMSGEIMNLMKNNAHITIPELAKTLNTTTRTVERYIKNLKLDNKIVRRGSTKAGVWEVVI